MRTSLLAVLAAVFASLLITSPASAQATRTWVSGVGDDANPCSRTAPCKTFAGAISKTAPGGEINVLDPGGFGAVTITKAVTIADENVGEAGVLVSGTNGIVIAAGANDVVVLRGLMIDGLGGSAGTPSITGVRFQSGAALYIRHCAIFGFQTPNAGVGNAWGVFFGPGSGTSQLFIDDSQIYANGSGTIGGGIDIAPTLTGNVQVAINDTQVSGNAAGIRVDGTDLNTGTAGITASIDGVKSTGNKTYGLDVAANAQPDIVNVTRSTLSSNNTGLIGSGAGTALRIGNSLISGNHTGVKITGGASVSSYGTNQITDNTNAGDPLPKTPAL
ncbi:MAG TPA: hypothetical protein VGG10_11895 [Rhizomicrobium sp.]|jgi:hypothetical protein